MDHERFYLRRHRVVNAGAGTGKTHALLTQYLHLLSGLTIHGRALSPVAVCALTFTEKAAGEMRERLLRRLREIVKTLAQSDAASSRESLGALEPELQNSALALGRELPPLRHYEAARAQLSFAPIGTFHSFASALLRRHAVAAGLDPDFTLLDEEESRDLIEEASERVVLGALEGQYGETLSQDAAQLTAEYGFRGGAHAEGGLVEALCRLYFARAEEGQGAAGLSAAYEPALLEAELARLREELPAGLRSLGAFSVELSGKSAELAAQLGEHASEIERLLRSFDNLVLALPALSSIRTELGRLRAKKSKDGDDGGSERLKSLKDTLKRAIAEARALSLSVHAAPLSQGLTRLLAVLIDSYNAQKRNLAALDFTDLLRRTRDLLRDNAELRAIERGRYAALLVDEFQDTNPLQAELVELLVGFTESDGEEPRRLYLVGDRKQSIYGFRGADVSAYERLCRRLLAAGSDEETLAVSRRSRPALLSGANALFSNVFAKVDDSTVGNVVWDEARDPLRAFREDPETAGPLIEILRDPATEKDDDEKASEAPADDPLGREARVVARRITSFVDGGFRYGDIVLLLRRYTHLLRYTQALKQAAIPHYVVRGRGFYQAQEILDLAAFLTVLDDPADRLAFLTVLRSPLCGLSDESLARLHLSGRLGLLPLLNEDGVQREEIAATLRLPRDEKDRLEELLSLLRALLRSGDRLGPAACLRTLFDHTDYLGVLYADPDGEQRVANVFRLCERARSVEQRGGTLRTFVRALRKDADPRIAEQRSERDEPTAPIASEAEDVVRIMTVHQAKGLEFPVVLVAGCTAADRVDSLAIAYDRSIGLGLKITDGGERVASLAAVQVHELTKKRGAAESSRLFYVAATRARERLCFAGEMRRGRRAPSGSWMSHLEKELTRQRASEAPLFVDWQWRPSTTTSAQDVPHELVSANQFGDSPVLRATAEQYVRTAYEGSALHAEQTPSTLALEIGTAADLAICGRRFHLRHMMHLGESELALSPGRDEDPLGTLAAQILDDIDPQILSSATVEPLVHAHLSLRGHDVRAPGLAELATRLVRFLQSPYVTRELATRLPVKRFLRAQPFDVPLFADGRGPRLRGVLDLIVLVGDPLARVQIIEYRYGYAPDTMSPLDLARQRLLAHVARQMFAAQTHVQLQVGICYLRESDPRPQFHDAATENTLEAELRETLLQAAPITHLGNSSALRLPVLDQLICQELRCGYQFLCHRAAQRAA